MTTATSSTQPIQTPGQLIANLPALLGFYPEDSLVLIGFTSTDPRSSRFTLGPVLRIDLDDLGVLPEIAGHLDRHGPDLIFGFLVTEREDDDLELIVDELFAVAEVGLIDISSCWVTRRILTGEPFALVFGPDIPEPAWSSGVVAPVTQAEAMAPFLVQGELPDLTRDDHLDHVARYNPAFDEAEADVLARFAHAYAAELQTRPGTVRDVVLDFQHILTEITDQDTSVEELMGGEELLVATATILAGIELRDAAMGDVLDHAAPAARLLLAVARTFGGTIRCNALCLYALAVIETGMSVRAMPALMASVAEKADHSLTHLMIGPCQAGAYGTLLYALHEGSRMVRDRYGLYRRAE